MATILKIEDENRGTDLQVYNFNEDKLLDMWMDNGECEIGVSLDETEVKELIEFLQKRLNGVF